MHWYFLISSYYLTVSLYLPIIWLFWMGTHWPHWKVKSLLWALAVSNGGEGGREGGFISFTQVNLKIWAHYIIRSFVWLFPYIFLLFDCFEWVLIDRIEKWRVHSELWQFQIGGREGGRVHQFYPGKSENLSSLAVWCFASQKVFSYYIRKT